ncbi:hypothetical protein B0H14DRAFT_2734551 [Mycena olivaceomarginata]|nr:hypothetical protein B0H14DRAFT_2734551 [Mycena olivaceomarginata]
MSFRLPKAVQRDLNKPLPPMPRRKQLIMLTQGARRDAIFAGMSAALVSAVIGSRFMGFGRTQMMLGALGKGISMFTDIAFVAANMMEVEKERERLSTLGIQSSPEPSPKT